MHGGRTDERIVLGILFAVAATIFDDSFRKVHFIGDHAGPPGGGEKFGECASAAPVTSGVPGTTTVPGAVRYRL